MITLQTFNSPQIQDKLKNQFFIHVHKKGKEGKFVQDGVKCVLVYALL